MIPDTPDAESVGQTTWAGVTREAAKRDASGDSI